MAQYWEDWSGSTIGQAPTGWTARWNTAGVTRTVETEAAPEAPAGRRLRVVTTTQARRGLSLDAVDADAARNTCEIAVLVKVATPATDAFGFGAMGRGSGAAASETVVVGGICRATSLKDRILYYQNGAATQDTANGVTGMANGDWVWLRFKLDGTTATLRFSTAADPNTILLTDTFAISSDWGAGWVGLFDFATGLTWDVAAVGVGTGTDAAPLSDPGSTAAALSGAATASAAATGDLTVPGQAAALQGDATATATATGDLTTFAAPVKGASVALYNGATPQANLTGITARWWDSPTDAGAPLVKTDTASTDASGVMTLDLNAATALAIGGEGYLSLYKAGADAQSDLHFASRVTVSDIG